MEDLKGPELTAEQQARVSGVMKENYEQASRIFEEHNLSVPQTSLTQCEEEETESKPTRRRLVLPKLRRKAD